MACMRLNWAVDALASRIDHSIGQGSMIIAVSSRR
jgi:hypothetical protein